ncbi:hypothetical protein Tco_1040026 [Tanacetum coccineum]
MVNFPLSTHTPRDVSMYTQSRRGIQHAEYIVKQLEQSQWKLIVTYGGDVREQGMWGTHTVRKEGSMGWILPVVQRFSRSSGRTKVVEFTRWTESVVIVVWMGDTAVYTVGQTAVMRGDWEEKSSE